MERVYCHLAAVAVRREPSHRSEMVNQLLYGESMVVVRQQEGWSYVRGDYDGYEGWVDCRQYRKSLAVDAGSEKELVAVSPADYAVSHYLGAPYLWGGRTAMGIDCSGLTQVAFGACGMRLLRDAWQQAAQGTPVERFDEMQKDDLCFFGPAADRITHVGICAGEGLIVHSSGEVRLDTITPQGIVQRDTQQLTHTLQMIRRMAKKNAE